MHGVAQLLSTLSTQLLSCEAVAAVAAITAIAVNFFLYGAVYNLTMSKFRLYNTRSFSGYLAHHIADSPDDILR